MWATDSSRAKAALGVGWLLFASVNAVLTFAWAGAETIPYHLIWASFAFVYGLVAYSRAVTWTTFAVITVVTGTSLVWHASAGIIDWTECSEIVLMGVILALLIWHVDRHRAAQARLVAIQNRERSQAHRRELAARFGSHEMRTRLTIARGFVELIGQAAEDDGIRADAQLVIGELDKTTTLATNLLTLVRVHQGGRLAPLEIDELVEAVVHRWRSTADRDWWVSSSVGTLAGDAERLEVALDCLLENAVKFTGIGDTIAVEACVSGSEMILTVTDAGSGIPAEDLHRVFDIFHTGSAAGDRAGSGLGLAVVRAIVEARGGTVSAASSIGQGSRFTIRAPVGDGGPAALFTADDRPVWPDVLPATGQVTGMPLGRARLDPPAPARNG